MSKVPYAVLKITISAEEDEINGPDEMVISNQVWDVEEHLTKWLKREMETEYDFEFEVQGE